MSDTIILIANDLMFLPRLENNLRNLGYHSIVATDEAKLTRALFQSPVLALVDLSSQGIDWVSLIHMLAKSKVGPVSVLGFGSHVSLSLRKKAIAAGCNAVVERETMVGQLPQLIEQHRWVLDKSRCRESPPTRLVEGIELFNQGQYFECHEIIEQAWIAEKTPIRIMYQGILQIGVACYHVQHKNWRGAMKVLERGIPKTRRFAPTCMGINLAQLLTDAEAIRQELLRLGPGWEGKFDSSLLPTIRFDKTFQL